MGELIRNLRNITFLMVETVFGFISNFLAISLVFKPSIRQLKTSLSLGASVVVDYVIIFLSIMPVLIYD